MRPPVRHQRQASRIELGGEKDVGAPAANSLADDPLRSAEAVHLGRVEEVDPEVERTPDDLTRGLLVVLTPVAPRGRAELPGAESDARDPRAAGLDIPQLTSRS